MECLGPQKPDDFSVFASHHFPNGWRIGSRREQSKDCEPRCSSTPGNARLTARLGRRLADQALNQGSDPDETRRARGEADFLTSRAVKLAPDNDEVKKLRDEVVKLLELKTD